MPYIHPIIRRAAMVLGLSVTVSVPMGFADTVNGSNLCTSLKTLTELAALNFNGLAAAQPLPDADKCRMIQTLSGSKTYHCSWKFPFRDNAASEAFEAYNQEIAACFVNSTQAVQDHGVNHPDSYQQVQHKIGDVAVSVSIKDKGALGETYVFVAVRGSKP